MSNEFDLKAQEWDKNPIHIERSQAIARVLRNSIPLKKGMKALEFGAGTGLLSFLLKDKFSEITLMDTSVEMINVIQGKISARAIQNMKTVMIDLENEHYEVMFDIIYNQMVFHHVANIDTVLKKFNKMLVPGGILAIADLYTEDGSFHGEGFTGHKGFDVDLFSSALESAGFVNVRHQPCYTIRKMTETGKIREYPVFMLTASR